MGRLIFRLNLKAVVSILLGISVAICGVVSFVSQQQFADENYRVHLEQKGRSLRQQLDSRLEQHMNQQRQTSHFLQGRAKTTGLTWNTNLTTVDDYHTDQSIMDILNSIDHAANAEDAERASFNFYMKKQDIKVGMTRMVIPNTLVKFVIYETNHTYERPDGNVTIDTYHIFLRFAATNKPLLVFPSSRKGSYELDDFLDANRDVLTIFGSSRVNHLSSGELYIDYAVPIYDKDNDLIAVSSSAIRSSDLRRFVLSGLELASSSVKVSFAVLVDGFLFATSETSNNTFPVPDAKALAGNASYRCSTSSHECMRPLSDFETLHYSSETHSIFHEKGPVEKSVGFVRFVAWDLSESSFATIDKNTGFRVVLVIKSNEDSCFAFHCKPVFFYQVIFVAVATVVFAVVFNIIVLSLGLGRLKMINKVLDDAAVTLGSTGHTGPSASSRFTEIRDLELVVDELHLRLEDTRPYVPPYILSQLPKKRTVVREMFDRFDGANPLEVQQSPDGDGSGAHHMVPVGSADAAASINGGDMNVISTNGSPQQSHANNVDTSPSSERLNNSGLGEGSSTRARRITCISVRWNPLTPDFSIARMTPLIKRAVKIVEKGGGATDRVTHTSMVITFNFVHPCPTHEERASSCALLIDQAARELKLEDCVTIGLDTGLANHVVCGSNVAQSVIILSSAIEMSKKLAEFGSIWKVPVVSTTRTAEMSKKFSLPVDQIKMLSDFASFRSFLNSQSYGLNSVMDHQIVACELLSGPIYDSFSKESRPWYTDALHLMQVGQMEDALHRWNATMEDIEAGRLEVEEAVRIRATLQIKECKDKVDQRDKKAHVREERIHWRLMYHGESDKARHRASKVLRFLSGDNSGFVSFPALGGSSHGSATIAEETRKLSVHPQGNDSTSTVERNMKHSWTSGTANNSYTGEEDPPLYMGSFTSNGDL